MEERKLIGLGNSSLAISLPIDWVKKANLKKGDKIQIVPNSNGELIVSPEFKKGNWEEEAVMNVGGKDFEDLRREFVGAYINGNSVFKFIGNLDRKMFNQIKKLTNEFVSCEIIEENKEKIVAKDFFNIKEMKLKNFVKRIDNNIQEMFSKIKKYFKNRRFSKEDYKEIVNIDKDIDKFYFLNSRIMIKGFNNPTLANVLNMDSVDLFKNWWFVFHLEHIGDAFKSIAKKIILMDKSKKNYPDLFKIFEKLEEKYNYSLEIFNSEKKDPYKFIKENKKTWELCENLTRNEDSFISSLSEDFKRIDDASYQIIKMAVQLENER